MNVALVSMESEACARAGMMKMRMELSPEYDFVIPITTVRSSN